MYVALNGSTVVYYDNPDALLIEDWTDWRIDLQAFADQGVDLHNVNTISIGFGDRNNPVAGGSGVMYFDDIRLYWTPEQEPAS
jgi:Ca2+-binding RTX toxin-like protein